MSTTTGVSTALAQAITHYGYSALAAAVLAENLGLPVPGETAVLLAAAASAAGQLNVVVVWLVAVCAAIIGDNIGFGLGHFGGKPFFVRFGPRIGVGPENYAMTERFFDRYGGPAVMVADLAVFLDSWFDIFFFLENFYHEIPEASLNNLSRFIASSKSSLA